MGATLYNMTETGKDVREVFNSMADEAVHHYGRNPYSGSIATTSLGHEVRVPEKLEKALKKNDWKTIEEYTDTLYTEKRKTNYIKTISHYQGYAPKWVNNKETVKRKKGVQTLAKFIIVPESRPNARSRQYDTLTEAKREAKSMSLRNNEDVIIKQLRSNGESVMLGIMQLETDGKKHKTQRTAKTKVYLPIYKFEFFVYAAT